MKRIMTFLCLILMLGIAASAQQRQISGTVTDFSDGGTLPGVTVQVKNTNRGTVTDANGRYQIMAEQNEILVFSFIGMLTEEKTVGSSSEINISLMQDIALLKEVVVTALGITRETKALGYSVTSVSGDQIAQTGEMNPISSLAGKVAGLDITQTTAGPSGSRRVVIRGISEITGNNQPLYVIDGIPVENSSLGQASQWGGFDLGDGTSDLNPEDIESISVLKGASASALYGLRALNGVILITTKKGARAKKGWNVEYNYSATLDVVSTKLDEYQTTYGQGSNGLLPRHGQPANNITSAWGMKLNPDSTILQKDGVRHPYTLVNNNIQDFFNVGATHHNTVALSHSVDKTNLRFSYGNTFNKDIIPGSGLSRNILSLRGTTQIGNLVEFDSRIAYSNEKVNNRPALTDDVNNIGNGLVGLAPNFNQAWLETYKDENGNYIDYTGNQYRANPYWTMNETSNKSSRDRVTGFVSAQLNLHKNLKLRLRSGLDQYALQFYNFYNKNTPTRQGGQLLDETFKVQEMNSEALLIYQNKFNDIFDLTASFGGNQMKSRTESMHILGTEINIPGVISLTNFRETPLRPSLYRKEIQSVFGFLQMGYNSFLFLDVTARNDWSSTLPTSNNSFFYPSVSASVVPTEVLDLNLPWLNFAKFRASWAQVGGDTDPYKLNLTYSLAGRNHLGFPLGGISSNISPNPNLLPQNATSFEVGTDFRLFNNRVSFDFTYFNQTTENLIFDVQLPVATGFEKGTMNSGNIQNKGIEMLLNVRPVDKALKWDISFNFSKVSNTVLALADMVDAVTIADARWAGVNIVAKEGEAFGLIMGRGFLRDPNGNIVHNSDGLPMSTDKPIVLGNILPDWTGGIQNTFSYKNIHLRTSIDIRMGGDIYSITNRAMYVGGTHLATLDGRDGFNDWAYRNEMARIEWINGGNSAEDYVQIPLDGGFIGQGVVITGEDENGNPVYATNNIFVNPQTYWQTAVSDIGELNIYDASYVKLRDLSIGYTLPRKLTSSIGMDAVTISLVGRNLFTLYKNVPNIDPESTYNNSNGQGLEYGSLPTRRHIGFNLNVKF